MYFSTKTFGPISTTHRQWRDDGHCRYIHGYGRTVEVTFEASVLDEKGWVMGFGNLRSVRNWLEDQWDHKVLIASDDPELTFLQEMHNRGLININIMDVECGYGPGIEQSAKYVYDHVEQLVGNQTNGRVSVRSVRIWEHLFNSAGYEQYCKLLY